MPLNRLLIPLVVMLSSGLLAQTEQNRELPSSSSDMLARALNAATGGTIIQDVALAGTARHIAGSTDENGRIELKALAGGETSIEMSFPSGNFKEVHAFNGRRPVGQWSGPDQRSHAMPEHNLFVDPAWFCPDLVLQRASTSPERVVIGEAASSQHSRDHLRVSRKPTSGQGPTLVLSFSERELLCVLREVGWPGMDGWPIQEVRKSYSPGSQVPATTH